jgi:hypothetical protein
MLVDFVLGQFGTFIATTLVVPLFSLQNRNYFSMRLVKKKKQNSILGCKMRILIIPMRLAAKKTYLNKGQKRCFPRLTSKRASHRLAQLHRDAQQASLSWVHGVQATQPSNGVLQLHTTEVDRMATKPSTQRRRHPSARTSRTD